MGTVKKTAALIVGGNGSIGRALYEHWQDGALYDRVYVAARSAHELSLIDSHGVIEMDVSVTASIFQAASELADRLEQDKCSLQTICICTGLLHDASSTPERRLEELTPSSFNHLMQVNALGPLLVARAFSPLLPKQGRARLLAISARVGSVSDNRLGGWFSYRCSKAALNQGFKTLAIEFQRTHPGCVVTLFHPGTVDTPLSKPFQKRVAPDTLFQPQRAAQQLSDVLHERNDPRAHLYVDWAGLPVEY